MSEELMTDLSDHEKMERIWRALPAVGSVALRPLTIARRLALPEGEIASLLRRLKRQGLATHGGGWWRRRGHFWPDPFKEHGV